MAKILLIEDDHKFRAMVRKMLEKGGYNDIEEAPNGSIGLELFRQQSFDLVITDLIMPEKEGIELIMELTKNHPRIKIIAMSGGGKIDPQKYLDLANQLGASRTLAKPFEQPDIIKMVQELLSIQ
jgi:CheY-like chemotaxis protein